MFRHDQLIIRLIKIDQRSSAVYKHYRFTDEITIHNSLYFIFFMFCWPCNLVYSCKQNQLGAQFFLICLLLFSTCFGQLCVHHQEKIPYLCDTWYLSLYIDDCPVCMAEFRPAYQTVIYIEWLIPVSHSYGIFSWWWAHSCPNHVEKSSKHIKKICAPNWFYLQDYTRIHVQQNIKVKVKMSTWTP